MATILRLRDRQETYNSHPIGRRSEQLEARPRVRSLFSSCRGGLHVLLAPGARRRPSSSSARTVAKKGLWREAAFRYEQAVAKEPSNARAHNNLAVALEANGDFARALAEYKKALEIDPNNNYIRRNYARFAEFYTSYTKTTGKASSAP